MIDKNIQIINIIIGLFLTLLVTIIINIDSIQFERLNLWPRILVPSLISLGFIGTLFRSRLLRSLGWIGIFVFFIIGIGLVLPGEDYISGGPDGPGPLDPRSISVEEISARFLFVLGLIIALVFFFLKAKKPKQRRELQ